MSCNESATGIVEAEVVGWGWGWVWGPSCPAASRPVPTQHLNITRDTQVGVVLPLREPLMMSGHTSDHHLGWECS